MDPKYRNGEEKEEEAKNESLYLISLPHKTMLKWFR